MKRITIELSDETYKELERFAHTYPAQSKLKPYSKFLQQYYRL